MQVFRLRRSKKARFHGINRCLFSGTLAVVFFFFVQAGTANPTDNPRRQVENSAITAGPPPRAEWKVTASNIERDSCSAAAACDGNKATRWSSTASDSHWLQIDMGRPAMVCGLTILWERAYANGYRIETSIDGKEWKTVYETRHGDGHTDIIYFTPTLARFVKFVGTARATSWGYSIWEIDLKGPDQQIQITAPTDKESDADKLIDGSLKSVWRSDGSMPCVIQMDLRQKNMIGGLRIDWGENYAAEAELQVSTDGSNWETVDRIHEGLGRLDVLAHPGREVRYLRLNLREAVQNGPIDIREITFRGPDEDNSPLALYRLAAASARLGIYPMHLLNSQTYWTVVGLPGDRQESLFDEYGNLESRMGSPSVMPYVLLNGELLSALDAQSITQRLLDAYIPIPSVSWDLGSVDLTVEALTGGTVTDSVTYVRYQLSNLSGETQTGCLYLAVRPIEINPPWQFGRLSPISRFSFHSQPHAPILQINFTTAYVLLSPPDNFGARAFDGGDVLEDLVRGRIPTNRAVVNGGDYISGALAYDFDLAPGEKKSVVLATPLHGSIRQTFRFIKDAEGRALTADEAFEQERETQRRFWKEELDRVRIEIPQPKIVDVLKSQTAYILINRDGPAIQPGSRNYKRSWIRDGGLTSAALLRMGLFQEVREYLDWYSDRVQPDGWVPPILNNDGTINDGFGWDNEYDSQGEYLYVIMEYYRFTRDREFLAEHFDKMLACMKYLVKLREKTLAPDYMKNEPARDRFVGLLPRSISHEGYNPPKHSHWDNFWALKGWKDGAAAARVLGRKKEAEWADKQYRHLRDSVKSSIARTMALEGKNYIPGCAEWCDFDPTSSAIALFPCEEVDILPPDAWRNTFEQYYTRLAERLRPGWVGGFTPYEIRTVSAYVNLGQKQKAMDFLDFNLSFMRPPAWNQFSEVIYSEPRLSRYIGDMPHTWVGSGYINSIRGMLVEEDGDILRLLPGVPAEWVTKGKGLIIENAPTYFGILDLRARAEANILTVDIGGVVDAPAGIDLYWPLEGKPSRVTVDGEEWSDYTADRCHVPSGKKRIVAFW